ncbi:BPSL0761 family protein [Paraburkholderia terrae]
MTTPDERTRAVLDTRDFLQTLAAGDEITIAGLVRSVAVGLLRHYPLESDISTSAAAAPGVWAEPVGRLR